MHKKPMSLHVLIHYLIACARIACARIACAIIIILAISWLHQRNALRNTEEKKGKAFFPCKDSKFFFLFNHDCNI